MDLGSVIWDTGVLTYVLIIGQMPISIVITHWENNVKNYNHDFSIFKAYLLNGNMPVLRCVRVWFIEAADNETEGPEQ